MPSGYLPGAFASAVLADGRPLIEGGEFSPRGFVLSNNGAIYVPTTDTWAHLDPPAGWDFIGDSPSVVLPDGRFLIGNKLDTRLAALDPATLTWTALSSVGKSEFNAEEGWTLLPDGTVLTIEVEKAPNSEKYIVSRQGWVPAGNTIVNLHSPSTFGCLRYGSDEQYCYYPPGEIGTAVLRPDGTVFATGARNPGQGPGHTAIYTPPAIPTDPGTWTAGPDFPNDDQTGEGTAALLPNGNVLVDSFNGKLYEFDGVNLVRQLPDVRVLGSLLVLPTGEVLVTESFPTQLYTPSNTTYSSSWAPRIRTYPATVVRGSTYQISGQQFNGLSQARDVSDEAAPATNYPLARITNQATGHVFYARTHDHSTMAVATGNANVSTHFDVPAGMETGISSLEVVANGIPSKAVAIMVN